MAEPANDNERERLTRLQRARALLARLHARLGLRPVRFQTDKGDAG